MKATTVLGGVQVVQMLVVFIRAKFIALLLGPSGMGVYSIFQSVTASVGLISNLGIYQSSIRDISQAKERNNEIEIVNVITIFKSLVWFVAFLGTIICVFCAPFISLLIFGNTDYIWEFSFLSIGIFLSAFSLSNTTILQGTRNLKYLSKASLLGSVFSLIISIPLYFWCGIKGIVPSIVMGYLISFIIGKYYVSKLEIKSTLNISTFYSNLKKGYPIIKLGIILMLSSSFLTLSGLILNSIISNYGTLEDVGYIQSSFSLANQSIIIIITVLASDYYPRLAGVINDFLEKIQKVINDQIEFITLLVAPLTMVLILFTPFIVKLLLSQKFMVIVPIVRWMALCLPFRCLWIVMSYVILAKGDKKKFFLYDGVIGNGLPLIMNIIAYIEYGIKGIGVAFTLSSIFSSFIILTLVWRKFNIKLEKKFIFTFIFYYILILVTFLLSSFPKYWLFLPLKILIVCLSVIVSIIIINRRTQYLNKFKNKIIIFK